MPGDWTCKECGANCFASRDTCFRCNAERPAGAGGGGTVWQGLDGTDDFEASAEADEAAFRQAFGPRPNSGIDFSRYADIPVEVELPPSYAPTGGGAAALPEAMQPVEEFAELHCGAVLSRAPRPS